MKHEARPLGRVLVVDDDQAIRQLLITIIERERIAVDAAADGAEAIALLRQNDYAVILLDLMMPKLDGFGVIEFLRRHPPAKKPIVLVITAYTDQKFKKVDPTIVTGVVRKPFEVADLGSLVRLCVNGYDSDTHRRLTVSRDSAIREIALRHFVGGGSEGDSAPN
jgi:CheY-like chemotaxis protein